MKRIGLALLLVLGVALVSREDHEPAPAPVAVEQRDPNLGPVGSVG